VSTVQSSGGVAALGKQKAVVAGIADSKSRRNPLGDIGNYVSVRATEGYEPNRALSCLCFIARVSFSERLILGFSKPQPQEQVNRSITRSFTA
jgi:hypothetical protein